MNRRELIKALGFSAIVNESDMTAAAESEMKVGKPGPVYLVDTAMVNPADIAGASFDPNSTFIRLSREFSGANILPLPVTRIDNDMLAAVKMLKKLLNEVKYHEL